MSSRRIHRSSSAFVAYPVIVVDPVALSLLGVLYGNTADGSVLMNRDDWAKVAGADPAPLRFMGTTPETNPQLPVAA